MAGHGSAREHPSTRPPSSHSDRPGTRGLVRMRGRLHRLLCRGECRLRLRSRAAQASRTERFSRSTFSRRRRGRPAPERPDGIAIPGDARLPRRTAPATLIRWIGSGRARFALPLVPTACTDPSRSRSLACRPTPQRSPEAPAPARLEQGPPGIAAASGEPFEACASLRHLRCGVWVGCRLGSVLAGDRARKKGRPIGRPFSVLGPDRGISANRTR